jgi:hypothetical protein
MKTVEIVGVMLLQQCLRQQAKASNDKTTRTVVITQSIARVSVYIPLPAHPTNPHTSLHQPHQLLLPCECRRSSSSQATRLNKRDAVSQLSQLLKTEDPSTGMKRREAYKLSSLPSLRSVKDQRWYVKGSL